jgi:indolepyruvate ferredoxin oxidoreductase
MRALLAGLDAVRLPLAVQIAEVPEQIRGFGHVKERQVKLARAAWDTLDAQWRAPVTAPLAQAA